jgi:hypothetical protein
MSILTVNELFALKRWILWHVHYRLNTPYQKCQKCCRFWIFSDSGICINLRDILGWNPNLNKKFIFVSHIPYIHTEGNVIQHFWYACILTRTHHMRSGMELSTCCIMLAVTKVQILDFQIRMFKVYMSTSNGENNIISTTCHQYEN